MSKRIVIALGGNALGNNPMSRSRPSARPPSAIVDLIEQGNEVIIAHGNGPQVGMIQNAFAAAHDAIGTPEMPLPECGAMSQGYIGYHLQQGIGREMHKRISVGTPGHRRHPGRWIRRSRLQEPDQARSAPSMTEEQAKEFMAEEASKVLVEDAGRGWRQVVPPPSPRRSSRRPTIRALVDSGHRHRRAAAAASPSSATRAKALEGHPAVIDKDFGGELLAELLDADMLIILTAVEKVAINFGKPDQKGSRT